MIGIFFFQAEDGIRDLTVTGVQTCALPIFKVDCGLHRAGVDPASPYALSVARELGEERGLVFDGIVSHSGHAYRDRKSTRLNSSHSQISYAVFCLNKKNDTPKVDECNDRILTR